MELLEPQLLQVLILPGSGGDCRGEREPDGEGDDGAHERELLSGLVLFHGRGREPEACLDLRKALPDVGKAIPDVGEMIPDVGAIRCRLAAVGCDFGAEAEDVLLRRVLPASDIGGGPEDGPGDNCDPDDAGRREP